GITIPGSSLKNTNATTWSDRRRLVQIAGHRFQPDRRTAAVAEDRYPRSRRVEPAHRDSLEDYPPDPMAIHSSLDSWKARKDHRPPARAGDCACLGDPERRRRFRFRKRNRLSERL